MLDVIGSILLIVPVIYALGVLVYRLLSHGHCVQVYEKVKTWLMCYCKYSIAHAYSQESLPDRIAYDHPEENTYMCWCNGIMTLMLHIIKAERRKYRCTGALKLAVIVMY